MADVLSNVLGLDPAVAAARKAVQPKAPVAPTSTTTKPVAPTPSEQREKAIATKETEQTSASQAASSAQEELTLKQAEKEKQDAIAKADIAKQYAEKMKAAYGEAESKTKSYDAFHPSQETQTGLATMFALTNLAAFMAGGSGRYAGMAALGNMTNAMKGYQAGRKDVFDREMKEYDKNVAALKLNNEQVEKHLKRGLELMSVDKEAAQAEYFKARALAGDGIVGAQIRYNKSNDALKTIGDQLKALREVDKQKTILEQRQLDREQRARQHRESIAAANERARLQLTRRDEKAFQAIGPALRNIAENYPDGTANTLLGASPKDKDRIQGAYRSVQESESVADFVARNKGAVGAMAAIKNYLKMDAIKSIQNQDENVAKEQKQQLVDAAIDKAVADKKISADDAQNAKILQKKLFGLALADVQGSGQRGSVYLDRQFQSLYDQASRQDTLLKIIKERAKENNGNLEIYGLNVERHNRPEKFPLLGTQKIEDYIKERTPETTKTSETISVGGKTYSRPAGMSDTDWAAYKKEVGVK